MLKRIIVNLLGRDRANRLSAPYHDWKAKRRTRHRLTTLAEKDLCINIGCGPNALPGWINLDHARGDGIDIVWDLRQGLPFPSESCTAIFGEHVIEHIAKEDAARLLQECHRVLQSGGVVRLSTPDGGRYLRAYANNDGFLNHSSFELPIETPMDRVNQVMREYGQHLWVYDAESLLLLLRKAGFSSATEQQFGVSTHPRMQQIDSAGRAFESLYAEGTK
jgi:predicted SAM-dependent methyltransferase